MRSATTHDSDFARRIWNVSLALTGVLLIVGLLAALLYVGTPLARNWLAGAGSSTAAAEDEHAHETPAEGRDSIGLSPQARRNIGLRTGRLQLGPFARSITVPGMVVERPGRTKFTIAAPMTGVVTGVHVVRGEAVLSGKLMFTLRLTHEDLVQAQTDFLRTLGQLDVEEREIARLESVSTGAVAGRVILERQYERDKLEAHLRAQREALRLHGLSEEQVAWIDQERRLLREAHVYAPMLHEDDTLHHDAEGHGAHPPQQAGASEADPDTPHARAERFVVEELNVQTGVAVTAGSPLCVLADYRELFIEGRGFEQDAKALIRAAEEQRPVSAVIDDGRGEDDVLEGLEIVYVANQIEPQSRALHFYVALPNEIVRDAERPAGRHFLTWRFKIGQRMQVRVPVEMWSEALVLPVDAVAQEGPEYYVFVQNGDRFERRPVHVVHRNQDHAVLANDGSLFPGETVAMNAAHQLQMAIKNQAGGGVDPHGHTH